MNGGILFKSKHLKILLTLMDQSQDWYISALAKASDTTYVHTCNFVSACETLGIMESEKHGKIKVVRLTSKGAKIADMLANANVLINNKEGTQQAEKKQETVEQ